MKLASIPTTHLLSIAREWLFGDLNKNKSVGHLNKILGAIADRIGDPLAEEGKWLFQKLQGIPDCRSLPWVERVMRNEDNPWSNYYRARALFYTIGCPISAVFTLLKKSATAGFAPAMALLWIIIPNEEEKDQWARKALQLNDATALYELSMRSESADGDGDAFTHCYAAAMQGHLRGMMVIATKFLTRLSATAAAKFSARYALYTGNTACRIMGKHPLPLDALYVAGRELEGYEQMWDEKNCSRINQESKDAIYVYACVTQRARRAALQIVTIIRTWRGRDVARLIGQLVYATREQNVDAWWKQEKEERGWKKI
jgi:hypothetical protein